MTQTIDIITDDDLRAIAWECYSGMGIRSATKLRQWLIDEEYGSVPRSTIQSWMDRGKWAERLQRENAERFPHLMREIAGDLMQAARHAAHRQLEANARGEILDRDEREQLRMAIDHGGFAPVGQALGMAAVRAETTVKSGDNISRWLSPEKIEAIRATGHLPALGHGETGTAETVPASD